jgi:hypothetical protein
MCKTGKAFWTLPVSELQHYSLLPLVTQDPAVGKNQLCFVKTQHIAHIK